MDKEKIRQRIKSMLPHLNEKQQRHYLAIEAESIGWGGKTIISELSGKSRLLIGRGVKELYNSGSQITTNRIRKEGGGRKKETEKQSGLTAAIKTIIAPCTVGDPERLLLWTSKSVRHIQAALETMNYKVSHELIRQILLSEGYSLQTNKKTQEGGNHPDRDAQFEFINSISEEFIAHNQPVISVDCKKKELIGNYKNNGREWREVKHPKEVQVYDFIDKTNGKASPYGVYDIVGNQGFVNVGINSDTAAFAVETIRRWWNMEGKEMYKNAENLYITADGGGSNGSRNRLWKKELQNFANETGLKIHVSHFPPGTSKWNRIEHRLFSHISMNWRGKPLESLYVILGLIGGTTTKTGLKVKAVLDENIYKTGIKVSDEELKKCNLTKNDFHGEWNYIINQNC